MRQAVHERFGELHRDIAVGLRLWHDQGAQFMSDDFQGAIRFPGIKTSPAFAREAEGPGWAERFFRTFKKQLLWVRNFVSLEGMAGARQESRRRYNNHWLRERLSFQSTQQARARPVVLEAAA